MKHTHTLVVSRLRVNIEDKEILRDISLTVKSGQVHVIMGPNGSGKSTFAYAIMGHPLYQIKGKTASVTIDGKNILSLPTEERAKAGLFLAFQSPIAVSGVSVVNLLRSSYQELFGVSKTDKPDTIGNPLLARRWQAAGTTIGEFMQKIKSDAKALHIEDSFLSRGIHDGFSGGEKKKMEMLQALTLSPKFAVFDEIDTGLDVDALKVVARGIRLLSERGTGIVIITHYQRILKHLKPDVVHILVKGKIVTSGKAALAKEIEDTGYERYL